MIALLVVMGIINLAGFVIHVLFTPIWGWAPDLRKLKPENRRAALTLNAMMAYVFGFFGIVNLLWAFQLLEIENTLVVGIVGFWLIRTVLQLIYFDLKQPLGLAFLTAFVFMTVGHFIILVG